MIVEQTITAVTSQPHTFKAHYKITHLGNDLHANSGQEFPAVYVNTAYNRFIYYGGTAPWTNGAVSVTQFQQLGTPGFNLYVPEQWGAHVDAQNIGLTVYVPSQYPYVFGFDSPNDGTNYFAPITTMTIGPNFVFESDIYLIAGDYQTARQIVYQLHQNLGALDISTPLGASDQPSPGSTVGGVTAIDGWAFDDVKVAKVEILVDGVADGIASYGSPRPDVADTYPNAPTNIGYSYSLDTTKYGNGPHSLNVRVTDSNGNVAVFADIHVTVSN